MTDCHPVSLHQWWSPGIWPVLTKLFYVPLFLSLCEGSKLRHPPPHMHVWSSRLGHASLHVASSPIVTRGLLLFGATKCLRASVILSVLRCSQPVTPLTSRMKKIYLMRTQHANSACRLLAACQVAASAVGGRSKGAEKEQPTAQRNGASTHVEHPTSCADTPEITSGQMQEIAMDSSTHLQSCLHRSQVDKGAL